MDVSLYCVRLYAKARAFFMPRRKPFITIYLLRESNIHVSVHIVRLANLHHITQSTTIFTHNGHNDTSDRSFIRRIQHHGIPVHEANHHVSNAIAESSGHVISPLSVEVFYYRPTGVSSVEFGNQHHDVAQRPEHIVILFRPFRFGVLSSVQDLNLFRRVIDGHGQLRGIVAENQLAISFTAFHETNLRQSGVEGSVHRVFPLCCCVLYVPIISFSSSTSSPLHERKTEK